MLICFKIWCKQIVQRWNFASRKMERTSNRIYPSLSLNIIKIDFKSFEFSMLWITSVKTFWNFETYFRLHFFSVLFQQSTTLDHSSKITLISSIKNLTERFFWWCIGKTAHQRYLYCLLLTEPDLITWFLQCVLLSPNFPPYNSFSVIFVLFWRILRELQPSSELISEFEREVEQ